ncbi:MAG: hypothetical protein BGO51_09330 [Rhodospirillales bacterium 69-11]|nr:hypothetical protein [Rhodospirillales bacterium]MBN8930323.1 hypothetical protein [Rhodospirillales bacterium]OJW26278.1 MAG: hypothetical protein BGO51_09330 [Rhodospirillales bacterium 69-11]
MTARPSLRARLRAWRRAAVVAQAWVIGQARRLRPIAPVVHAGDVPIGPRAAIYAHHDPDGAVRPYVHHAVSALTRAGYAVVFVSNGPLTQAAVAALRPHTARIVTRPNRGWDFAAWRDGLATLGPPERLSALILTNDSVYGPLRPLPPLLAALPAADVVGMTDSEDLGWHLQSWFLWFGPAALRHPAFAGFWRGVRDLGHKDAVIRLYEVGLSRCLRAAGLRCTALAPTAAVEAAARTRGWTPPDRPSGWPSNPAHDFWAPLVLDCGVPFLKRDLLAGRAHRHVPDAAWRNVVAATGYDAALIEDDLAAQRRS